MAEILKGGDGIAQVYRDALPDVAANAALHQQQAGGGEAGRNQQHGEQEARAQAQARQKSGSDLGRCSLAEKNRARIRETGSRSQRTNLYPMPCTVRKCTGLDGSFSSFWRSLRM